MSMFTALRPGAATLLALLLAAGPAAAQSRADRTLEAEIAEAEALLDRLEYEEARARLEKAARDRRFRRASPRGRAQLFVTLGRVRAELGDEEGAETSFLSACRLDPTVKLPNLVSPKIRQLLERARSQARSEAPSTVSTPPKAEPPPRQEKKDLPYRPLPRKETPPRRKPRSDLPYEPLPRKAPSPSRNPPRDAAPLPPIPGSEDDDPWSAPDDGDEGLPEEAPADSSPPRDAEAASEPPLLDDAWSRPPRRTVAVTPIRSGLSQGEIIGLSIAGAAVAVGLATLVAILASDRNPCDPAQDAGCTQSQALSLVRF